jgi:hypothetical protein
MIASLDAVLLQKDSKISHIKMLQHSGKIQKQKEQQFTGVAAQTIEQFEPEKLQEAAKKQSMSNHDVFR